MMRGSIIVLVIFAVAIWFDAYALNGSGRAAALQMAANPVHMLQRFRVW